MLSYSSQFPSEEKNYKSFCAMMGIRDTKKSFSDCFGALSMVILIFLCTLVFALPTGEYNPNYPLKSEGGKRNIKEEALEPVNLDATVRQDLSICERKEESSVFAFGRCPESCEPFSVELFAICAGMVQFGCELQICGAGQFKCTLKEDLSSDFTVCPGDKVVFDSVELDKLQKVRFSIDLKANPLKTDFYLLSDATGSMASAIATAKSKFQNIVDNFSSRPDVAFGVGFYRDEAESGLVQGFKNVQPLTTDVAAAKSAVDSLVATGGGDGDEANLVALYKVATDPSIGWRDRSRKIIVYFGDYPGHEPTCVSGLPDLRRGDVVAALKAQKITVIAASFTSTFAPGLDGATTAFGCGGAGAGTGQGSFITAGTAGSLVPSTNQAALVNIITTALTNLSKEFDVDESECVADITSVHNPVLPVTVPAGGKTTVTNTLSVKPSVCEATGKFECNYKYTESGADLEKTTIELVNIKGCPSS